MDDSLKIGNRIMALREEDGLTQAQLAERVGVSQATVSQWESGTRTPSGEAVVALARVFDTSADFCSGSSTNRSGSCPTSATSPKTSSSCCRRFRN